MAKKKTYPQQHQNQRAQAAQATAAARQKRVRLIVALVVVVALILVVVVVWQVRSTANPGTPGGTGPSVTGPSATGPSATGPTATGPTTTPGPYIPPNGTAQMGWIEVKSPAAKPDALIVSEHTDYQCPWCQLADSMFGASFRALAERGDIVLRIHIRTLVGDRMLFNDSSVRAAMAATCADTVGKFIDYNETVFANQPKEGVGFTDQQLRVDFAAKAGITGNDLGAFQACYDTGQTKAYVLGMEQINWTSTTINGSPQPKPVQGTPTFFVNGTPLNLSSMITVGTDGKTYVPAIDNSPDGLLAFLHTIG